MNDIIKYGKYALLLLILCIIFSGMYTNKETQQVVITQFGRVIGDPVTNAGLHFKIPFIQTASFFPKNILEWDGEPGQFPTSDKRYIHLDTFGRWRIADPVKFMQSVGSVATAQSRISDVMTAATKSVVAKHTLIEIVRNTNRDMDTFTEMGTDTEHIGTVEKGRSQLMALIHTSAQNGAKKFGIELSDVKTKRVNYIDSVRQKVYVRMAKERNSIAAKYISEGKGAQARILGEMDRELREIESGAKRTEKEILGKAEAAATKALAAVDVDPEFFEFWQTLRLYKASFGKGDTMYLSTDSRLLNLMNNGLNFGD